MTLGRMALGGMTLGGMAHGRHGTGPQLATSGPAPGRHAVRVRLRDTHTSVAKVSISRVPSAAGELGTSPPTANRLIVVAATARAFRAVGMLVLVTHVSVATM